MLVWRPSQVRSRCTSTNRPIARDSNERNASLVEVRERAAPQSDTVQFGRLYAAVEGLRRNALVTNLG